MSDKLALSDMIRKLGHEPGKPLEIRPGQLAGRCSERREASSYITEASDLAPVAPCPALAAPALERRVRQASCNDCKIRGWTRVQPSGRHRR